jgi:hypothetical protein
MATRSTGYRRGVAAGSHCGAQACTPDERPRHWPWSHSASLVHGWQVPTIVIGAGKVLDDEDILKKVMM